MKQRVDFVEIIKPQGYIFPISDQLDNMFFGLSLGIGVEWYHQYSHGCHGGDRYQLEDEAIANFLDEWGDNYEALEFFERCAEYLAIKE